jgi:NAD(P)-dependent dehydrogenase (short-subunit alcohol dehydrogenase family)
MHAVIIGGSGGIGLAFIQHLQKKYPECSIHATYHRRKPKSSSNNCHWYNVDITRESQIKKFCAQLGEVDLCINAAGMLHDHEHAPEKSVKQINQDYFAKSMSTNALPTLLLAKYMAAHLKHKREAIFASVSARVGSIEENYLGGWYSYRASKAALNMILKTLSIEWKRSLPNVTVAALHPGTTDTRLSRPFQHNVAADHLFAPEKSVDYMMQIIDHLKPSESGKFWSFDGEILPW